MTQQPLTINEWQNGMADSPHLGFGLLQNVDIDSFTGAARVGKKSITGFHATYTSTFTANAGTDICTASSPVPNTGTAVTVSNSGGALPTGLAASTIYYIINLGTTTFKLATTLTNANAGTAIDITGAGSGTNTVLTVDPGTIMHFAYDPRTTYKFALDSNGRTWVKESQRYQLIVNAAIDTGTGTLTNAAGNGIALFRTSDGNSTYLFVYRNALIDVINVFGTVNVETPSWTNAWKSMNSGAGSGNSHYSIVGQDNIIYFCDDRYIGSIQEKAGQVFDPTNAATYTYNNQALDLPLGSLTYWLEQLGVNLLISVSNDAYIYPWDRSSDSYGLPLPVAEFGINKMKNIGNVVYIFAGTRGNVYWTQGTYVKLFKTIPIYATYNSTAPAANPVTWGGIGAAVGKLIFGVGALSGKSGVYALDTDGHLVIDNYPSTGQANVTAIFALNEFYDMGYAGGADYMDTSRYSSLGAVIVQSALYRVATKVEKTKYSRLEVQIATAVTGSIRVGWRNNLTGAFTTITTFITDTSNTSYTYDCGLIDIENIQVQVEMSGNIDLMEVNLFP